MKLRNSNIGISTMKRSMKVILVSAFVGTLGFGGLARIVYAGQPQPQVAIMPQHRSSNKVAQAINRNRKVEQRGTQERESDRETNDDVTDR
jgi:hypothetical protein